MDHKSFAELEMSRFDRLSPEWRALVREHNYLPGPNDTVEQYMARVKLLNDLLETTNG